MENIRYTEVERLEELFGTKRARPLIQWLHETDLGQLALGRHEIGEGTYANVQEYETKLESVYEAHRRYADIQLTVVGREEVAVAPLQQATKEVAPYDENADCVLYGEATGAQRIPLSPRTNLLVLMPEDAHMPCMAIDGVPEKVKKIVVKVKIEGLKD